MTDRNSSLILQTYEAGSLEMAFLRWSEVSTALTYQFQGSYEVEGAAPLTNAALLADRCDEIVGYFTIENKAAAVIGRFTSDQNDFWNNDNSHNYVMFIATSRRVSVQAASDGPIDGLALLDKVKSIAVEKVTPKDDERLEMRFWSMGSRGATHRKQLVESHKWDDISRNYPENARNSLQSLVEGGNPASGGKLILWHGQPGGGKTHAIQSIATEWRDWCSVDYIIDAENFFGYPEYMISVLNYERLPKWDSDIDEFDEDDQEDEWRLIVVEDAGSFLRRDAGTKAGQAFSRLLNITDGLLGQGVKVMVLITTNEPLSEMHPALRRPGRCMANIEFGAFSPEEASGWLGTPVDAAAMLAELYVKADSTSAVVESQAIKKYDTNPTGQYL